LFLEVKSFDDKLDPGVVKPFVPLAIDNIYLLCIGYCIHRMS